MSQPGWDRFGWQTPEIRPLNSEPPSVGIAPPWLLAAGLRETSGRVWRVEYLIISEAKGFRATSESL